jgi:hypothetical protein
MTAQSLRPAASIERALFFIASSSIFSVFWKEIAYGRNTWESSELMVLLALMRLARNAYGVTDLHAKLEEQTDREVVIASVMQRSRA